MSRLSNETKAHLDKARESALLAVETYNRPGASFRSGGYVVLMCIAWTALFHAIYFKRKIKPFYRKKNNRRHFEKIDGDHKAWELATCIEQYWGSNNPPERANITFFIGLRNKIEHRSLPTLDITIFGECQSLLFNFEDVLVREFGDRYAINESLSLALQFSCIRNERQVIAVKKLHRPLAMHITEYVNNFRSSLGTDMLGDPRFSFKVFLMPRPANSGNNADAAVEFVKFDLSKPDEMERYERIVALIKPSASATSTGIVQSIVAGAGNPIEVKIADKPGIPVVGMIDYDKTHPHFQDALIKIVNQALPEGKKINQYDLQVIRKAHQITEGPYLHQGITRRSQFSKALADWMIQCFFKDNDFFLKARAACRPQH